ncbi:hypothetical protein [Actinoplanes auranticolor]|uniref:VWFA domain-containing protein n=1 Tax=Actinoplanes auranticolor TaxID=47988 RepID=A0A919S805_9ACTN|nr:hypothetical protein [Actinoplanes auranticolor]GIM65903.1 hypothetical protein Aau02nite_20580 [Actinoplanes auranticolor]
MPDSIPLILTTEPVKMVGIKPARGRTPSIAVVYATRDGDLEVLDGGKPMRWSDQVLTKYRTRYEVDISHHHLSLDFIKDPLPTQNDTYHFNAAISVSFRVTDPAEVIEQKVQDAVPLIRGHLLAACRPITRQYAIEEAEEAEQAIHARFHRDTLLTGGITILAVQARLSLDDLGRTYLQDLEAARREENVKTAQHPGQLNDVARQTEIELLRQAADHRRQERERLVIGNRALDPAAMVQLHLERNPGDTAGAMKMLADLEESRQAQAEKRDDRWQSMLGGMAENGLIQQPDIAPLVTAAVRHLEGSAGVIRTTASVQEPQPPAAPAAIGWDDPLPQRSAPAPSIQPVSPPPNLVPVYLIVDESPVGAPWIDDLQDAVQQTLSAVAGLPRIAAAVRLSVLGYADGVSERVPLSRISDETRTPPLVARGSADHGALFRWLLEHVPAQLADLQVQHPSVRPPSIVLVSAAAPRDDDWAAPHQRLLNQRRRPEIVSIGLPGAAAKEIGALASFPELAFVSDNRDATITGLTEFLRRYVIGCGQAALDGTESPIPPAPSGFRIPEQG